MATAVAYACDANGAPLYDVVGVDLDTSAGRSRVDAINRGTFPFGAADAMLAEATAKAVQYGNLRASVDPANFGDADVIVVDVGLDVALDERGDTVCDLGGFQAAIETLGDFARPDALFVVETTAPPGTCRNVVRPTLSRAFAARGIPGDDIDIAHSYERVMPGPDYLSSIINYWRVYAADTERAADRCEAFLTDVVNVREYPLRRLSSTVASETAKILENSYRAVNIAFVQEWTLFAERYGVNLFEVIDAVRDRPTHVNIRQPGLGVGGYCLTKDPLFPEVSHRFSDAAEPLVFPFGRMGVATNAAMPRHALTRILDALGRTDARVLMLGVAYRPEVDDTRSSAAETLYRGLDAAGCEIAFYDPYVRRWPEIGRDGLDGLPEPDAFDAVLFCVGHAEFRRLDVVEWLGRSRPLVYDCDRVLSGEQIAGLRAAETPLLATGRGDLLL